MPQRLALVAALCGAALLPACRRAAPSPADGGAAPTPRAAEPARSAYRPPGDGRLSKAQVEAYLGVLEKLKLDRSRKPSGSLLAPGDPLDLEAPDVVVARARGLNVSEYLWVRERVLEAEAAALSEHLMSAHLAMLERTLSELKTRRAAAPDEGSKRLLAEQAANFEAEANRTRRESREKDPDNVRANMKTIEPFRARLEAAGDVLDQPLPRAGPPPRTSPSEPAK